MSITRSGIVCVIASSIFGTSIAGRSAHIELSTSNSTLELATEADLENFNKLLEEQIKEVKATLAASTEAKFQAIKKQQKEHASALQERAVNFLKSTHKQLYHLQVQEWRLTLAVRHGVHGRCCCGAAEKSNCLWVDYGLLQGYQKLCPASSQSVDYIDHHSSQMLMKAKDETADIAAMDELIDSCIASFGWQNHVKGSSLQVSKVVPAKALSAIEAIAAERIPEPATIGLTPQISTEEIKSPSSSEAN
eukprot:TRINITY_DN17493_c0_g1_i1.p1 TRINITY_DN17493_c0_g1~~TRINITY_DN17493_c0_g1_i1.p1  ORF type:complete len:249 (-),score=54.61 TRINITY_DN17493_c0_g1_i1:232-978(-)